MGLFGLSKKKESKKASKKKDASKPKKESFEVEGDSVLFNAKVQILTKSKEYAQEISKKYVESIKQAADQKSIKKYYLVSSSISKPEKINDEELKEEVYRVILEFDVGVKDKTKMFDFCFEYMPFFVEIIEPMSINFSAHDLTDYLTTIQGTLHKIDEELKKAKMINTDFADKYQILTKNMIRMLRNNILLSLKEKSKTLADISKNTGIPEDQLDPFLSNMVKDKEIKLDKGKYSTK